MRARSPKHLQALFRTSLYRNAFWLMTNTVLTTGIGFAFWIIVTRYYPSSDVGLAAATISSLIFLGGLANLGLAFGLVRFLPEAQGDGRAMINSCLTISGLAGLLAGTVFLVGLEVWARPLLFLRAEPAFIGIVLVLGVVMAIMPTLDAVLVARRESRFVALRSALTALRVPLPLLFAPFFGVFGIVGAWAIAMAFAALAAILFFLPRVEPGYRARWALHRGVMNDLVHFSFGNYVAGVLTTMPAGILPLIIVNLLGPASVAHFYVSFSLASLLYIAAIAVSTSLFAEGSQPRSHFLLDARRAHALTFAILVPASFAMVVWGGEALAIFGPEYVMEGFALLQLLSLSAIFVAVDVLYVAKLRVEKKLVPIVGIAALVTALILVVSYGLLGSLGIAAVGVAWLVGEGSLTAYLVVRWAHERAARRGGTRVSWGAR